MAKLQPNLAEQTQEVPPDLPEVVAGTDARIDVTAQLVSLEPGLFTVDVVAPAEIRTEGGMVLPCVRIDPLPRVAGERAFVSALSETSLLTPSGQLAYLRVTGGRTSVLLTTYKAAGPAPAPEIRITLIDPARRAVPVAAPPTPDEPALPSEPLMLLTHVENHGDMRFGPGVWAGAPAGSHAIEGFALSLDPALPRQCIEYQAVLGQDWSSPWMEEGEFCGSRQLALPLLGLTIRLRGQVAEEYGCKIWCRFSGVEYGPFTEGEVCRGDGTPLTGLRVVLIKREPPPVVADKPKGRSRSR